jgi:septal ring factor EnvC (AmiA/AmiB activator)
VVGHLTTALKQADKNLQQALKDERKADEEKLALEHDVAALKDANNSLIVQLKNRQEDVAKLRREIESKPRRRK